jgi:hypothetical protein
VVTTVVIFLLPTCLINFFQGYCGWSLNGTRTHYSSYENCSETVCKDGTEYCGGSGAGSSVLTYRTDRYHYLLNYTDVGTGTPNSTTSGTATYSWQGCWNELGPLDPPQQILQTFVSATNSSGSVTSCAATCATRNGTSTTPYTYMAVDRGGYCYCGINLDPRSQLYPNSDCQTACLGDSTELCGGLGFAGVYKLDTTAGKSRIMRSDEGMRRRRRRRRRSSSSSSSSIFGTSKEQEEIEWEQQAGDDYGADVF